MSESEPQTSITAAGAEEQRIKDTRTSSSANEPHDEDQVPATIEQEKKGYPDQPTTS